MDYSKEGKALEAAVKAVPAERRDPLIMALSAAVLELLRRTGWRQLDMSDMPARGQDVLLWLKGGENAVQATCNRDSREQTFFLLANTGTFLRDPSEVEAWMPLPGGPYGMDTNPKRHTLRYQR